MERGKSSGEVASCFGRCIRTNVITTLSTNGQAVIPESIRKQAQLRTGDKLDVSYINGLVVLRKRVPFAPAQARAFILAGREMPVQTARDKAVGRVVISEVRKRRRVA